MIDVEHLSKTYRVPRKDPGFLGSVRSLFRREVADVAAVRDVSFRVGEGEIVGLIGANGAGKTTLVKMLAGIVHPSAGRARVLGFDPWERDNRFRAQIALVMGQKAQLWWDLPPADALLLLQEIYRVPDAEFRASVEELTSTLGLTAQQLRTPVRKLSLGERMKAELLAALAHRPRVLFLDEPTIGLDVGAQRAVHDFVLRYRERHRPAIVLTSHSMDDIERLCARVLILKDGGLVFDGALADVVARWGDSKTITVQLDPAATAPLDAGALTGLGEVLEASATTVRLRVPRDRVASAAGEVLRRLPVADLLIEETDVGTIVERIFSERGGAR